MSIYQQIWDADQAGNGIRAIRQSDSALKNEKVGYVIVNETLDDTEARVLSEVFIPEAKRHTYDLCDRLFDNYALDPGIRELITDEEATEEREFIRDIILTQPLQIAKDFLARDLGQTVTDTDLAVMIEKTWFLQGKAGSKFASGFEHVFVGEQKDKGDKPDFQAVKLGGYHFWYKYYLDDGGKKGNLVFDDRIKYKGTRYGNLTEQGILVPEVVTLSFEWTAPDTVNQSEQRLSKPIGGFWVGCSPECMIALGLIRVLSSVGSSAVINGATYDVKFFPLSSPNEKSIRTFYPEFKRADFGDISPGNGSGEEDREDREETTITKLGEVRIIGALVNPAGDESGKETVTLLNTTPKVVNLDNWKIKAPNGWEFTFADVSIGAGEARGFRMVAPSPQFRNKGGTITLLEPDGKVHEQVEYSKEQARKEGYTIKF